MLDPDTQFWMMWWVRLFGTIGTLLAIIVALFKDWGPASLRPCSIHDAAVPLLLPLPPAPRAHAGEAEGEQRQGSGSGTGVSPLVPLSNSVEIWPALLPPELWN